MTKNGQVDDRFVFFSIRRTYHKKKSNNGRKNQSRGKKKRLFRGKGNPLILDFVVSFDSFSFSIKKKQKVRLFSFDLYVTKCNSWWQQLLMFWDVQTNFWSVWIRFSLLGFRIFKSIEFAFTKKPCLLENDRRRVEYSSIQERQTCVAEICYARVPIWYPILWDSLYVTITWLWWKWVIMANLYVQMCLKLFVWL